MKKNREELENTLYIAIEESTFERRKIKDKLTNDLKDNHNISPGKTMRLYNKSLPLSTLSNAELYAFTKALFDSTGNHKINPEEWFNPEEVKTYSIYKDTQYYKGDVITFYNVDQTSDHQWCCSKATYPEMNNIFTQGMITYNFKSQRNTTTITFNNIATEVPTIKSTPIIEMTKLMLDGKFTPNMITLNIRKTGTESYEYNAKERTLSIAIDNENSHVDIVDGMHRCLSMMRAVEINPNIDGYTFINFLNVSEDDAGQFIDQEDHRTPINPSHTAAFRNNREGVMLAKYIDKYGNEKNNAMFNQLAFNDNELKSPKWRYVTIETFDKAFEHNWKVESPREFNKIQKYMVEFFNELLGILKEKKLPQEKTISNNIFIGYIALSSILYKKENWSEILEKIVDKINFNDDKLVSLGVYTNKVNLSVVKRISEYFKKIGAEVNV
jgi:hypothetical protein